MKAKISWFLVVSSLSFGTIVFAQSDVQDELTEWTEVQTVNGIVASFGETFQNGIKYLNIQFENKSNKQRLVSWSLSKEGTLIVRGRIDTIDPNTTIEVFNASKLIPIGTNESIGDFNLSINKSIQTQI